MCLHRQYFLLGTTATFIAIYMKTYKNTTFTHNLFSIYGIINIEQNTSPVPSSVNLLPRYKFDAEHGMIMNRLNVLLLAC